ncbi:hypothetical protein BK669_17605 [Pseudomonas fluorescens]|nr:hypothetical protein BK669_17605 [Pseudomonas fluorescens]
MTFKLNVIELFFSRVVYVYIGYFYAFLYVLRDEFAITCKFAGVLFFIKIFYLGFRKLMSAAEMG